MSFKDGEATRFRNFGANSGPPQKKCGKQKPCHHYKHATRRNLKGF